MVYYGAQAELTHFRKWRRSTNGSRNRATPIRHSRPLLPAQEHPMLSRLTRRLRHLHDDLVYRTYCSPSTGIVGRCDPVEPGMYERVALGTRPACRWCHRETR